jgi:hypothetical protein
LTDLSPVRAQQRRRGDEECGPPRSWKEPSKTGEDGSIGWLVAHSPHLAAQDLELMAQDQDLGVLLGLGHAVDAREIDAA